MFILQLFFLPFSFAKLPENSENFSQTVLNLPVPGAMISTTDQFSPVLVRGITFHPQDPLNFDFFIDTGESDLEGPALEKEAGKLIKYFLAALTVPEENLWVNLFPYEKDRIIEKDFAQTEMGRDLLAQDYILKQLTASMMYPEKDLGREFWQRVYSKAQEKYGTTQIPMDTFNKVWILPEKAVIREYNDRIVVTESRLKVMLEEDYLAQKAEEGLQKTEKNLSFDNRAVTLELIKEIIIPELEKEVNEGKTFATLRQIYNSMVLAVWYKKNLKESLLGQVYMDQSKI